MGLLSSLFAGVSGLNANGTALSVIGNNIAPDLTSADLSAQLGGVASRGGMNIEFFYNRIRYGDANGALAGKMETRLYVADDIIVSGLPASLVCQPYVSVLRVD